MATATTNSAEVVVTLTLSEQEAAALYRVTGLIGGLPSGLRGVFSDNSTSIRSVLEAIPSVVFRAKGMDFSGSITADEAPPKFTLADSFSFPRSSY